MVIFSERLRALRTTKNLSQTSLAERAALSVRQIIRYEQGVSDPTVTAAVSMCKALGVSLDYLCGLSDNPHRSEELFPLEGEEICVPMKSLRLYFRPLPSSFLVLRLFCLSVCPLKCNSR